MKTGIWYKKLPVVEIIGGKTLKVIHPITGATILLDEKIKFEGAGKLPKVLVGSNILVRFENMNPCGWQSAPNGGRKS